MFPPKGGISQTMSACALLTGLTMNYHRHCRLEFREYVQTHEEHDNSLNPRTIGALALHPTGNVQGGYFFLSLTTGKVINRMCWTRIPMPKEVIDQVERMARQEHVGLTLLFEDRHHNEIIDLDDTDDDDSAYEPNDNNENDGGDDDDDDNDEDDDDNNNILINQPNEGHNDPGILGGQNAQQDNNEENNNDNDIVNDNGGHDNDGDATVNTHDEDDDESVDPADKNENALQNVHGEDPGGTTGVAPLLPIQVQNAQTQRELSRIAWMGQQPATFAGRTQAQSRANATTNVTMDPNTTTEFERDLFRRRVAGIRLPPEYEDQLTTLKHAVLTQYTLKKGYKFLGQKEQRQYSLK